MWSLIVLAVAVLLGLDKIVAVIARLGYLPAQMRRLDRERARKIVREEETQRQLERLLEVMGPNGGSSVIDKLDCLAGEVRDLNSKLTEHLAAVEPLRPQVEDPLHDLRGR